MFSTESPVLRIGVVGQLHSIADILGVFPCLLKAKSNAVLFKDQGLPLPI